MRPHATAVGRWLVYLLLAIGLMAVAAPRSDLNPRSRLADMVAGTAWRPYVKRALPGWTVRAIDAVIPAAAKEALARRVEASPLLRDRLRWDPAHATWFALVFLIQLVSLVAFAAALERWLAGALGCSPGWAFAGGVAGLALLPLHFGYQNFLYDFPGLALFTIGLAFLGGRRWDALYVLWPIGLLNKETFALLMLVFLASEWGRMPRRQLVRHLAAQAAITVAVLLALGWIFRVNPGPPVEFHLMRNLTLRPPPRQLVHDAVYWAFVVFAFVGWKVNRRLAAGAALVLATLFVATLFLGFLGEYRDFYEAWPLLAAMALLTTRQFTGRGTPVAG